MTDNIEEVRRILQELLKDCQRGLTTFSRKRLDSDAHQICSIVRQEMVEWLGSKNTFIAINREVLADVGEWAECMDEGRFIFILKDEWQTLKQGVE